MLVDLANELKQKFYTFLESTKKEVASPSFDSESMNRKIDDIREHLKTIICIVGALHETESSMLSFDIEERSKNESIDARAVKVTQPPEDLPPLPPSARTVATFDAPENCVPDVDPIWDEPETDEGRVLYSEAGPIRCGTLNKLFLHMAQNQDLDYTKTFIKTFTSFTSPSKLLTKLIQVYRVPESKRATNTITQIRSISILKHWVETRFSDFSPKMIFIVEQF